MKRIAEAPLRPVLAFVVLALIVLNSSAWAETVPATITSLDPRFDQLVPKDTKLEKIADGFTWVEGPVWHKQGGHLVLRHSSECSLSMEA